MVGHNEIRAVGAIAGASGVISFDEKGDRKDAEMTIFTMKAGKITPLAIIKGTCDNILGLLMIATWPVRALLRKLSHTRA